MHTASGKVILLGEHAVVHGAPALAAALARGAEARARHAGKSELVVERPPLRASPSEAAGAPDLARAFGALLAGAGADLGPVRVDARVGIPIGAGLGSSAALGVAIVRALDALAGRRRAAEEVAALAEPWERIFHGNPSGIDAALAARGGVGLFRRGEGLRSLALGAPLHLVLAQGGARTATKTMVARVEHLRARDPRRVEHVVAEIAALVEEGAAALTRGDVTTLGRLFDANHARLAALEVSTPRLDAVCERARAAGALGAKLTGAGGGGYVVALAATAEAAEGLVERLRGDDPEAFAATVTP